MFDSQKIDAFFDGRKTLQSLSDEHKTGQSRLRYWLKLLLPCLAAIIFGLMVIIPNIRKSVDLKDNVTIPRKNEMEKLHMEQTVFNSTDNKNRVNKITADSIDESEDDSQVLKIVNPHGDIPTDSGRVDITAAIGFFNQSNHVLRLQDDVRAVVNGDTVVTTDAAVYDFANEKGWNNTAVYAEGEWGELQAESFSYDKNAQILTLHGNNKVSGTDGYISSARQTEIFQKENKSVSVGNAEVNHVSGNLYADKIVAYFSENGRKELVKAEAYGNVKVKTPEEEAYAAEGMYIPHSGKVVLYGNPRSGAISGGLVEVRREDNVLHAGKIEVYLDKESGELLQAVAVGSVEIITPNGMARGDSGIYNPQQHIVELFDNVELEQNGNIIFGDHAETNLLTSVSRINSSDENGGRIHGTFYKRGNDETEE